MSATDLSSQKITSTQYLEVKRVRYSSRKARWWMCTVLVSADLLSLTFSFVLAIWLRLQVMGGVFSLFSRDIPKVKGETLSLHYQNFAVALFLFILLFYLAKLYPANGLSPVREMKRLTLHTSFIYLGLATASFMGKTSDDYSRLIFGMSWIFSVLLLPLMRFIFRSLAIERLTWGEPVALVGSTKEVKQLAERMEKNPSIGLNPAFLFTHEEPVERLVGDLPILQEPWLYELCEENQIECVLVGSGQEHLAENYQAFFKRVIVVKTDALSQLMWVSVQDLYGMVGYEIQVSLNNPGPKFIKRSIDIIGSTIGLLVLAPFITFLALLIVLDSVGPVIYEQIRVGKHGQRFKFLKLRTMYQNADQLLEEHLRRDPAMKREWDEYQKLHKDPRVTRVGRFLRRFSLDEIPQLFNVLIGDMSLVGPRPFFPTQEEFYGDRLSYYKRVRPGLTGMWQISGKNEKTFCERTQLDEYYVRNWSIWLDVYILARTIPTVLLNQGDY